MEPGPSLMDLYRMYINDELIKITKSNIMYDLEYAGIGMLIFMSIQGGIELYLDKDKNPWMKKVDLKKIFKLKPGQTITKISWEGIPVEINATTIGLSFTKCENNKFLDMLEATECYDGYELHKIVSEILLDLNEDLFNAAHETEPA